MKLNKKRMQRNSRKLKTLSEKASKYILLFTIASVLWLCFIFWNSFQSGDDSGAMSSGIAMFIKSIIDPLDKIDYDTFHIVIRKLAHFIEFCILAVLVCGAEYGFYLKTGNNNKFAILFTVLLAAVLDEFIQSFTGRGSSVRDVLVDFSGGAFGTAFVSLAVVVYKKLKIRRNK